MRARIICPVYNEVDHIDRLVEQFASKGTLVLVDGGSTDGSIEKLESYAREERIIFLQNPKRFVSHALNKAIERVNEDIVIRIDAHTDYAEDYVDAIIRSFEKSGADIVGGPTGVKADEPFQKAVAQAICTPFGMGGGKVHDLDYEGNTDAVTFGSWRKDVLERIGPWDTDLIRNQDDEHHYRAYRMGMRIYQDPSIRLWYHPRKTIKGLFRQYYQYGLYKPLVWEKVDKGMRLRHLVPSLFVLYLILAFVRLFTSAPLFFHQSTRRIAGEALVPDRVSDHALWIWIRGLDVLFQAWVALISNGLSWVELSSSIF
jgi:glycosyltransferase involved in cell wall biosynthesis